MFAAAFRLVMLPLQLQAWDRCLSDAKARTATVAGFLAEQKEEAARLKAQAESKDKHAACLDDELRHDQLRAQQADAAKQAQQQQELDAAKAEVAGLQGQLEGLRAQLADAAQREATLQQLQKLAEQEVTWQVKATQVRGPEVCV